MSNTITDNSQPDNTPDEIDSIIAQACTDAIAAIMPPGKYPLDTAIIAEARRKLAAVIAAARIDELEQLIHKYSEQHTTKQEVIAVHDNISKGSTLAMVPVVHINDRLEQLRAASGKGRSDG